MAGRTDAARDDMRRLAQHAAWVMSMLHPTTAASLMGEEIDISGIGRAEAFRRLKERREQRGE